MKINQNKHLNNGISKELQLGKAAEHFVCCDLILQGYNAFLTDQGVSFDIVVEKNGILKKIQVKSTSKIKDFKNQKDIYRFSIRRNGGRICVNDVDVLALVAFDIKSIAYIDKSEMLTKDKKVKITIDFKTKTKKYIGRKYSNGTIRNRIYGRFIEDFKKFNFDEGGDAK